jgi:lipopolysaccharide biosynthesis glycosyltransferase
MGAADGADVRFHPIDASMVAGLPSVDRFGTIVWLRLMLPELLPDVDRVLYLDSDTLVIAPIRELWDTAMPDAPLAAVANVVERSMWPHIERLGLDDPRQFFNTGVLLMDLARMRTADSLAALIQIANERQSDLVWPDQDALNIAFAHRWQALHPRWNAQNSFWDWAALAQDVFGAATLGEAKAAPSILHFEGPSLCKPWHFLCRHEWREEYWRQLRQTPWGSIEPEDKTVATRFIARLPASWQLPTYRRLHHWRVRTRGRFPWRRNARVAV